MRIPIIRRNACLVAFSVILAGACANAGVGPSTEPSTSITPSPAIAASAPPTTHAASPTAGAALQFPLTVENCGEEVTVFQQPSQIMTVGNVATNHVIAAGGADLIIARAGPHDGVLPEPFASAVADIPIIDEDDPSPETILGAGVDTVISYGLSSAANVREAGISSLVVASQCDGNLGTFDEVYHEVEWYGELFGTQAVADAAISEMRQRVGGVDRQLGAGRVAASAYFFGEILTTDGNQAISAAMMEALGLTNAFADVEASFMEGNLEELIDRDPEVLILIYGYNGETFDQARDKMLTTPGVAAIRAVRDGNIVGLFSGQAQNDPAAIDGLADLEDQLAELAQR